MITKVCKFCNKKFDIFPYQQSSASFCREQCYHDCQRQSPYPLLTCGQCGKSFRNERRTRNRIYCSQICSLEARYKYSHNDKQCPQCQLSFKYSPRNPFQKYCSRECQSESQKLPFNQRFFENINSEKKPYILGLIFTDGCIYSSKTKNSKAVNFASSDKKLVALFRRALDSAHTINHYKNAYSVTIRDKKLFLALKNLGVKERKSWASYTLPQISKPMMRHFLRGVYDGDGSFYIDQRNHKHRYLGTGLTSNCLKFLEGIKNFISQELKISAPSIISYKNRASGGSYQLRIARQKDVQQLTDYLYKNSSYFLGRKLRIINNFYGRKI